MADYIEVGQEPDGCQSSVMCLNPTQYATYYAKVAGTIRSGSSSVQIGGPVTGITGKLDYIDAMGANYSISVSLVNFISQHSYNNSYTANSDNAMLNESHKFWPNTYGWTTEYNASLNNGSCLGSSLDNNDPTSVGWIGANLIAGMNAGNNLAYYTGNQAPTPNGCSWIDSSGNLEAKDYSYKVMAQIGLTTGTGSVKSTNTNGAVTEAAGAVNSAGNPVVALANWFTPLNVTVTLNNLSLSGTVGVTIYIADFTANHGTSPFSTFNVNVVNGSTTFVVPMTADSTAGVILGASVGTSTPPPTGTPTPTPTATPTPAPGAHI